MEVLEGGEPAPPVDPARTFDAKPLWARTWVISAGVIMNLLFALLANIVLAVAQGEAYVHARRAWPRHHAGRSRRRRWRRSRGRAGDRRWPASRWRSHTEMQRRCWRRARRPGEPGAGGARRRSRCSFPRRGARARHAGAARCSRCAEPVLGGWCRTSPPPARGCAGRPHPGHQRPAVPDLAPGGGAHPRQPRQAAGAGGASAATRGAR